MKIVYLVAGAGGMYCGSCLHGNTLAAAMSAAGQDCVLVPMYTPLRTDEESVSVDRVAFGGINVYLQQHSAIFRRSPWAFDRLLDRPGLLRWASSRSAAVQPRWLGPLTLSMLEGEHGRQRKELEKLVRWLGDLRPDVVHLNNALLIGVAREIMRQLGVAVVCSLTGEDVFVEKLPEPYRGQALDLLCERAAEVAALVAMNRYYADFMAGYLHVPRTRICVIPPGLNLAGIARRSTSVLPAASEAGGMPALRSIGFLARICPDKGLHQLAAALKRLAADPDVPPTRVQAAGYLHPDDWRYLTEIEQQMAGAGLMDRFEYVGELDRPAKLTFLQSLDVFCLPTVYRESKGLSVFEAWANAVPAVLPAHGAFPEMVADTGGGVLCEPGDPTSLAAGLKRMILNRDFAAECGRRAQQVVHERYNADVMARRTIELYAEIGARGQGPGASG
jgi:glycosyltransferase involved in cell wall biosynthesis